MDLTRDVENATQTPQRSRRPLRRRSGERLTATIFVTQRFDVPPERVFDAWLDPAIAGRWLFATATQPMTQVQIDARPGGTFLLGTGQGGHTTRHAGTYVQLVRPRRLVFDLASTEHAPAGSRVAVGITPLIRGCRIDLTHEQVPLTAARLVEARWIGMFYGLGLLFDED